MKTLTAILQLIPVILAVVQSIESALPIPGAGKQKLDLVLGAVQDVYAQSADLVKELPQDKAVGLITSIVNRVVGMFNSLGVFKK